MGYRKRKEAVLKRSPRKIVGACVFAVVVCISGVAYAFWSSGGSGLSTTKALTATTVTVTGAAGAADLYPGFTGGSVYFTVSNSNPYPITFTSMAAGTVTSSNPTACPASNVTVGGASGLSLLVGAGATTVTQSVNAVVSMASAAPDGCQGITFTVVMTLTGAES